MTELVKCRECGAEFAKGALHYLICAARICERCHATARIPLRKDSQGRRICEACLLIIAEELE